MDILTELKQSKKIVGVKQSTRAVESGNAAKAVVAVESDERVKTPFEEKCRLHNVELHYVDTMKELGRACGIEVGAAVAVIPNSNIN